jgi:outer membrane protein assembly factor BamB
MLWRLNGFTFAIIFAVLSPAAADDWNQWLGPNRDSVWNESGIITGIPEGGLKAKWRTPISQGFSGPAVADGRVFVMDYVVENGDQSFDPSKRNELTGTERVHCLDLRNGKVIWTHKYPCQYSISYGLGPRATPTVDGENVYTLGAEGHLYCLNVADGRVRWMKNLKQDYGVKEAPMWGYAAHPLVTGDKLFCLVGGKGSVAVAFDKNSGDEIWRALDEENIGYCPPTMVHAGGKDQLLIWHAAALNSLNPATGDVYWSVKISPAYFMSIVAPIKYKNHLLVTGLQGSSTLLELNPNKPGVTEVWRGRGVQPAHNPPVVFDDHIYGVDVKGHLRCIELVSGKRIWEDLATAPNGRPAASTTGFVVRNGKHWYLTTEQGELIIAKMSPDGYQELGRAPMIEPTSENWGRKIVWSHPAFSNRCVFARNDKEIVCYSLAK